MVWSLTFITTPWTLPLTTSWVKDGWMSAALGGVTVPSDTLTAGSSVLICSGVSEGSVMPVT